MHPRLLVLDEPTSALDPTAAEDVLATLTRLVHDLGVSVLLAEHRLERVVPFVDRMALLHRRAGVEVGEPADILARSPVVPPLVELGRKAGWSPLPLTVREARRRLAASSDPIWLPAAPPDDQNRSLDAAAVLRLPRPHGRPRQDGRGPGGLARPGAGGHRADGTQRRGQVVAAVGAAGLGPARGPARWTSSGTDPATVKPAVRRELVGLLPQTAADLLYLETVDEECAAGGEGSRELPRLARPRHPRRPAPARPVRGAAAGARAGPGPHRPAAGRAPRRAHPRARLRRQARAGREPPRPRRRGARRAGLHPRRRVRRRWSPTRSWCMAEGEVVSSGPVRRVLAESPAFAPQVMKVLGPPWLRVEEVGIQRRCRGRSEHAMTAPSRCRAARR